MEDDRPATPPLSRRDGPAACPDGLAGYDEGYCAE